MNLLRATIRSLLLENDANEDDLFSPQQFETDKETAFAQMEDLLAKELGVEFAISQEFKDIIPPFEEIDIQKKKYAIRNDKHSQIPSWHKPRITLLKKRKSIGQSIRLQKYLQWQRILDLHLSMTPMNCSIICY